MNHSIIGDELLKDRIKIRELKGSYPKDLFMEDLTIMKNDCLHKDACPYLNFEPAARVLAQRDYLNRKVDEMERIMDLAREKIKELREENRILEEQKKSLKQKLNQPCRKMFKPNSKKEGKSKKKRGSPFGHRGTSRKRPKRIDEYVDIYPNKCDRCGTKDITIYEESFEEHIVQDVLIKV